MKESRLLWLASASILAFSMAAIRCSSDDTVAPPADGGTSDGNLCGNGKKDPGEQCDGTDFGTETCTTAAMMPSGKLSCSSSCKLVTTGCMADGGGTGGGAGMTGAGGAGGGTGGAGGGDASSEAHEAGEASTSSDASEGGETSTSSDASEGGETSTSSDSGDGG